MPSARTDIESVLVIGSGPIVIGQACEFDYSGTQACRVLQGGGPAGHPGELQPGHDHDRPGVRRRHLRRADHARVRREGHREGAPRRAAADPGRPDRAERGDRAARERRAGEVRRRADRRHHRRDPARREPRVVQGDRRDARRARSARSSDLPHASTTCSAAADELGYPVVVRPVVHDGRRRLRASRTTRPTCAGSPAPGLHASPTTEVLLEESILGWKEYELEVMRDKADNVVVVCSIENVDPMGVHTGDSITVAPAMTLTDREYQRMRDIGIAVIREVGVDTGGCNIQFAVDPRRRPADRDRDEPAGVALLARWRRRRPASRSPRSPPSSPSATPSTRSRTTSPGRRPASFEPTLDYVVVKVPRFAFEKFPAADATLTTHMKTVGEAMAIGRNFTEALQKALRSLEKPDAGLPLAPGAGRARQERAARRQSRRPTTAGCSTVMDAHPRGRHRRAGLRGDRDRPVVPGPAAADQRGRRGGRRRAASSTPEVLRAGQAARVLRRADRRDPRADRGRRPRGPARARHPPGLQDGRHLRRRVRRRHAVPLLVLRRGDRGRAARAAGGAHPRLRAEPDRAGHRVRLLLRARRRWRCARPATRP